MANIKDAFSAEAAFTITLASLASSAAFVGRQSTLIDNTTDLFLSALISLAITTGTTPTANTLIYLYLLRQNNDATPIGDDGCGTSDAGLTMIQSKLLGSLQVPAATSNTTYKCNFDTSFLGPLGPKWGIGILNATQVNLNATAGNHVASWRGRYQTVT